MTSDEFPFAYDYDYDDDSEDSDDEWECAFPDRCIMQGEHMRSECHTAEDAAEYAEAMEAAHPLPIVDTISDCDPNDPFYGF
jgi:hypothetical protein